MFRIKYRYTSYKRTHKIDDRVKSRVTVDPNLPAQQSGRMGWILPGD